MNYRAVTHQIIIFSVQWLLMLLGFFLLSDYIALGNLPGMEGQLGQFLVSGLKALFAMLLSIVWLLIWDRQVRAFFYRRK